MNIQLCPVQQIAFDAILRQRSRHPILELHSPSGYGRSTLLQQICLTLGGVLLQIGDLVEQLRQKYIPTLEEMFEQLVMNALTQYSIVLIDDLHLFRQLILCSKADPDDQLFKLALSRCSNYAKAVNKTLILSYWSDSEISSFSSQYAYKVRISSFQKEDYAFLCYQYLEPAIASSLNYERIFRLTPNLNGYQLKKACIKLQRKERFNTDQLIEFLESTSMVSIPSISPNQSWHSENPIGSRHGARI